MNSTNKYSFILVAVLLTVMLSSCLKEDLSVCPRPFQITVKVVDADGNGITESGDVEQVIMFVFDEEEKIFKSFYLSASEVKQRKALQIVMDYPGHSLLKFVAWGNLDENVDYSNISDVKELKDLYVRLRSADSEQTDQRMAYSPSDLFYGTISVPVEYGGTTSGTSHVLEITRKTAGVTITSLNLKQWNGNGEGSYSYSVRESLDTYDMNGNLTGTRSFYSPPATFNKNGNFVAPIFYIFPAAFGKSIVVDILYNGEVIFTADRDSMGKPFNAEVGRTLNILIDFKATLSINVNVTPWNQVFQYVEYL